MCLRGTDGGVWNGMSPFLEEGREGRGGLEQKEGEEDDGDDLEHGLLDYRCSCLEEGKKRRKENRKRGG